MSMANSFIKPVIIFTSTNLDLCWWGTKISSCITKNEIWESSFKHWFISPFVRHLLSSGTKISSWITKNEIWESCFKHWFISETIIYNFRDSPILHVLHFCCKYFEILWRKLTDFTRDDNRSYYSHFYCDTSILEGSNQTARL